MKEWEDRLGKKSYHGGEKPDEADFMVISKTLIFKLFKMYAVLKSKYNSKSF
jgi:hypothetical protein